MSSARAVRVLAALALLALAAAQGAGSGDEDPAQGAVSASLRMHAKAGYLPEVNDALAAGAEVDGRDAVSGKTALMLAAEGGHEEVADVLLMHANADKDLQVPGNAKADAFFSALMLAAQHDHVEMVQLLMHHGVDATLVNAATPPLNAAALATGVRGDLIKAAIAGSSDEKEL